MTGLYGNLDALGLVELEPELAHLAEPVEVDPDWWPAVLGTCPLKAPFPWFGGKSKVAELIWDRFGEVVNYVESFYGSGAVLLGRPHKPVIETVNDADGHLTNFWRSVRANPEAVAHHCDWPVLELDLHARHRYLTKLKHKLAARLLADPTYYNPMIAGWWVWGLCLWIGGGWCAERTAAQNRRPSIAGGGGGGAAGDQGTKTGRGVHHASMHETDLRRPHLSGRSGERDDPKHGVGINSVEMRRPSEQHMRLPAIGGGNGTDHPHLGRGVNSASLQLPALGGSTARGDSFANHGKGVHGGSFREQLPGIVHGPSTRSRLYDVFDALCLRLRYVRVTCGDFERILSPAVTWRHGTTAVFLDPPYVECETGLYSQGGEREAFERSFAWALANGPDKRLRIAFCYFDGSKVARERAYALLGEHPAIVEAGLDVTAAFKAAEWEVVPWKARGGYGAQDGDNTNAHRERIAFSPGCLGPKQRSLFA